MPKHSSSNTHILSIGTLNTSQYFNTMLGGHFKPQNRHHQNVKNLALNRLQKALVYSMRWNKNAEQHSGRAPLGAGSQVTQI